MTWHGSLTIFLTLLMAGAPLHCLSHAGECVQHHAHIAQHLAEGEPLPVEQPPPPCDNESGCICRGAVLAEHVNPSLVAPKGLDYLLDQPALHFIDKNELASQYGGRLACDHCPAPLSGRMLRARLASFLI